MSEYDIIVKLWSLPSRVRAAHTENPDGSYTIIINKALSVESQRESYRHELKHIRRGDLFKDFSTGKIEYETHECGELK